MGDLSCMLLTLNFSESLCCKESEEYYLPLDSDSLLVVELLRQSRLFFPHSEKRSQ